MEARNKTLGEYIIENQNAFQYSSGELSRIINSIRLAAKVVNYKVNKAGLVDIVGAAGEQNIQGEDNTGKRGRGRPRLEETMNPEWYKIIIDAGVEGKHITQFLIELGISWDGHYRLLKTNKKYSEAFNAYQKLCEEWWYNKAYESMSENNGAGFNTRLWQVIMTNKFKNNWKSEKH